MKKVAIWCAFFAFFLLQGVPFCGAAEPLAEGQSTTSQETLPEAEAMRDAFDGFLGSVPPEVADLLPEGFFSQDMGAVGEAVREQSSLSAILSAIGRATGLAIGDNLALLARLCGVLILSAVLRGLFGESGASQAFSFCATLTMVVVIFFAQRSRFFEISALFETVKSLSLSLLPFMGALYAMGGNVAAAAANHGVMTAFLSLLETVIGSTALPVAGICLSLGLLDALSNRVSLRSLGALIKRTYTWTFSLLMLLLCGVLGLQTTLAKGSDGLAMRTLRFATGSFLPVVGGSVSEALRTVAGSVGYLRSVAGGAALLVLFFAFLPTFVSVLLNRIVFLLCASVAKMLRCDGEEKILSELSSIYGYFMAVIASLFVMMTFSLTLLARCATAGGGL